MIFNTVPLFFLAVFLPLFLFPASSSPFQIPKLTLVFLVVNCVLLSGLLKRGAATMRLPRGFVAPLIAFAGLSVISMLISSDRVVSLQATVTILYYVVIALLFERVLSGKYSVSLPEAAAVSSFLVAAVGIFQHYGVLTLPFGENEVYGTIGNQHTMGIFLACTMPCLIYAVRRAGARWRLLFIAAAAVVVWCLVLLDVSGAWLVVAVGFAVFPFSADLAKVDRRKLLFGAAAGLLLLNAGIIAFAYYYSRDESVLPRMIYAYANRISTWKDVARMAADRPVFGWGAGMFMSEFSDYQTKFLGFEVLRAHNEFLQVAAEMGAAGWLLFCAALALLFSGRPGGGAGGFELKAMGMAGVAAVAAASAFSFPLHEPATAALFAMYAGACAAGEEKVEIRINAAWLKLPVVVFLFYFSFVVVGPLAAECHVKKGMEYEKVKNTEEALKSYRRAARRNPQNGYARFLYGASLAFDGKVSEARFHLEAAEKLRDFGSLHYVLGALYLKAGEREKAAQQFSRAKRRDFRFPKAGKR